MYTVLCPDTDILIVNLEFALENVWFGFRHEMIAPEEMLYLTRTRLFEY